MAFLTGSFQCFMHTLLSIFLTFPLFVIPRKFFPTHDQLSVSLYFLLNFLHLLPPLSDWTAVATVN